MDNRQWLAWLQQELWAPLIDQTFGTDFGQEKRKLTMKEFRRLKQIALSHDFIVEPHHGHFGFGFGLTFHAPPSFPGVPTSFLCCINSTQLPQYDGRGPHFDLGWRLMSPLSHNPENGQLLAFHGFSELKEKSLYDY